MGNDEEITTIDEQTTFGGIVWRCIRALLDDEHGARPTLALVLMPRLLLLDVSTEVKLFT